MNREFNTNLPEESTPEMLQMNVSLAFAYGRYVVAVGYVFMRTTFHGFYAGIYEFSTEATMIDSPCRYVKRSDDLFEDPGHAIEWALAECKKAKGEIGNEPKYKQVVYGEYVATPIKNAFNNKTSYWMSKDGYTIAMYMFTAEGCLNKEDLGERLSENGIQAYIDMFENRLNA